MNWFTRAYVAQYPHVVKQREVEQWGGCKHVEKDPSLLHIISYENDSFGKEGYCLCEACHQEAQKTRDEETEVCHDCHQDFQRKDLMSWTPYDYYPAQGDEPIYICVGCQTHPTHRDRIARDQDDYRAEFGDRNSDFGDLD